MLVCMALGRKIAALAGIGAGIYGCLVRPLLLTWGANKDEVTRTYPTDELIPVHDSSVFTMATTLPVPPEKVWPWLAQMGGDRAGWYSWDRLDHWGYRARIASCLSGRTRRWGSSCKTPGTGATA